MSEPSPSSKYSFVSDVPLEDAEILHVEKVVGNKGKLIFISRCGSWAYNMNVPTSDRVC
jgi:hypothetical protein